MDARLQDLPFDPTPLITSHHQNNYGGAVKRLNAIRAQLSSVRHGARFPAQWPQARRADRHQLDAAARAVLRQPGRRRRDDGTRANASFGSVERWREEFIAMGKALGGGSGWVLLVFQPREGTLVNQWAADHSHAVAGGVPILALDMYAHAYHMDDGAAAGARSMRSWATSTGKRCMPATSMPCTRRASRSAPAWTRSVTRWCSTCAGPACSRRPTR
jgi:Fe-Mn family superoxide dismutase